MRQNFISRLRRFRKNEEGNSTVEFAIAFPALMTLVIFGAELGFMSLNHSMLERAVDQTVRDIRLGTGAELQHDDIRNVICERASFIRDCETNMYLEMIQLDPFEPVEVQTYAYDPLRENYCTNHPLDVNPARTFSNGQSNDLMVMRACVEVDPLFPGGFLGASLTSDERDEYALVATTVFVQEPR